MSEGEICLADSPLQSMEQSSDAFMCSLPATSEEEAAHFLEVVGSGGALGTGGQLWHTGVNMPGIRQEYERLINDLVAEVERRRQAGQSSRQIAEWVVRERRQIANRMRWRSGAGTRVLFEIRDWVEYGPGGRSFNNVERRYMRRGFSSRPLNEQMIRGATHPNTGISNTAIKGARYLRHGGRVIVVFSLATTAYVLLTAPQRDLERLLYEEAGGLLGGSAGAGIGVGVCLVFGIATGGWGLLACGVVGGLGGGIAGTYAGNQVYYSRNPRIEVRIQETGVVNATDLVSGPPPEMCIAP